VSLRGHFFAVVQRERERAGGIPGPPLWITFADDLMPGYKRVMRGQRTMVHSTLIVAVMLIVMLVMAAALVIIVSVFVMLARMLVPSEMFAVVMMLVLVFFVFLGELLLTFVEDLTLTFPLLMPVAVAPGVSVAPLVALVPRMALLPTAEVPSARAELLLDPRMMLQEPFEIRVRVEIRGIVHH
jgi:hypothetical protein